LHRGLAGHAGFADKFVMSAERLSTRFVA
jgi:hypothetical protein